MWIFQMVGFSICVFSGCTSNGGRIIVRQEGVGLSTTIFFTKPFRFT